MEPHSDSFESEAVKRTVMDIIEHGSVYDVEKLDELYADNMQIIRIGKDGKTSVVSKKDVLSFFNSKRAKNDEPLSKEAHFNYVDATNGKGHVIVTRVMKLFGSPQKSIYNICLAKHNDRWRIVKETVISV
ncbi:MAG: hypothetical protein HZA00_01600 [Nitrospinae bacterium]|nr:hypothetical protein [Nitrospinota bacterium]